MTAIALSMALKGFIVILWVRHREKKRILRDAK